MNVWRFVWSRKWLVLVPVALFTTTASVVAYSLPVSYRSQTRITVTPPRVPESVVRSTVNAHVTDRLHSIKQQILSRTRLESIISEFDLYDEERKTYIMEDIIARMRDRDVSVEVHPGRDGDSTTLTVSFESPNPKVAMRVSERLASLFVKENMAERELLADSTNRFVEAEIEELARRVDEFAVKMAEAEAARRPLPQSAVVEYEELQNVYRALLVKREESKMAVNMERRQIGEQFRVLEGARLPERPEGMDRLSISLFGATAGFGLGLVMMFASWKRRPAPGERAPAMRMPEA